MSGTIRVIVFVAAAIFALMASRCHAAVYSTDGTMVKDTHLRSGDPNFNYGATTQLTANAASSFIIICFDLSGFNYTAKHITAVSITMSGVTGTGTFRFEPVGKPSGKGSGFTTSYIGTANDASQNGSYCWNHWYRGDDSSWTTAGVGTGTGSFNRNDGSGADIIQTGFDLFLSEGYNEYNGFDTSWVAQTALGNWDPDKRLTIKMYENDAEGVYSYVMKAVDHLDGEYPYLTITYTDVVTNGQPPRRRNQILRFGDCDKRFPVLCEPEVAW